MRADGTVSTELLLSELRRLDIRLYRATRTGVSSVYFETRHADTADFIRECFRDDLEIRSGVLEVDCSSFYAKPEEPGFLHMPA
jgi:hypothetical protein